MIDLPTEMMMQLVRARYTCLVQLRDLGRRQLELIAENNITGLLDLLTVKHKPLGDIQRVEKALDPYRSQDPEKRQWRSAEDRAACARLVEECDKLLKEIVAQEKKCEEAMVEKRDATTLQLHRLHAAGEARGAYAAPVYAGNSLLDLSSER